MSTLPSSLEDRHRIRGVVGRVRIVVASCDGGNR